MGKRIIRYFEENIVENIDKIAGNQAVVILKSDLAYKGVIAKCEKNNVFLQVNTNKLLMFSIENIQEIQIDKISLW
jgi:hypothetical protein